MFAFLSSPHQPCCSILCFFLEFFALHGRKGERRECRASLRWSSGTKEIEIHERREACREPYKTLSEVFESSTVPWIDVHVWGRWRANEKEKKLKTKRQCGGQWNEAGSFVPFGRLCEEKEKGRWSGKFANAGLLRPRCAVGHLNNSALLMSTGLCCVLALAFPSFALCAPLEMMEERWWKRMEEILEWIQNRMCKSIRPNNLQHRSPEIVKKAPRLHSTSEQ